MLLGELESDQYNKTLAKGQEADLTPTITLDAIVALVEGISVAVVISSFAYRSTFLHFAEMFFPKNEDCGAFVKQALGLLASIGTQLGAAAANLYVIIGIHVIDVKTGDQTPIILATKAMCIINLFFIIVGVIAAIVFLIDAYHSVIEMRKDDDESEKTKPKNTKPKKTEPKKTEPEETEPEENGN